MAEEGTNQTALMVIVSAISTIIGAALAKIPSLLSNSNRSRREDAKQLAGHYTQLFLTMKERIDALEERHDKCLEEHAETRGEIRALQLRLDFLDGKRHEESSNVKAADS